jgi:hypothetical protein
VKKTGEQPGASPGRLLIIIAFAPSIIILAFLHLPFSSIAIPFLLRNIAQRRSDFQNGNTSIEFQYLSSCPIGKMLSEFFVMIFFEFAVCRMLNLKEMLRLTMIFM